MSCAAPQICFKWSEYMTLHELFHARASMHRSVYTHKKAKVRGRVSV